jgi:hypothetical protein
MDIVTTIEVAVTTKTAHGRAVISHFCSSREAATLLLLSIFRELNKSFPGSSCLTATRELKESDSLPNVRSKRILCALWAQRAKTFLAADPVP